MLVQAILGRKLLINQMYEIMNKVAQLSITSESESVQLQCRKVLQYVHITLRCQGNLHHKGYTSVPTGLSIKEEIAVLPQSLHIQPQVV